MRARSIIGLALTAALTLSAAPTVAAPALTVATPGRTRPSTAAFCTTMDHFLGFMRSAPRPAVLLKPAGRKLLADLVHTAPHAAARPAATLAHSLAHVAEHGRHSLSTRANRAANASLAATARYVIDHCSSKRVTHAYAQLLAGQQTANDTRAAQLSLRDGLSSAEVIYTDTDSYAGVTGLAAAGPGARTFYDQHREAGDSRNRALRALANRLVGILHGCLDHDTLYDEHTAWGDTAPNSPLDTNHPWDV